MTVVGNEIGLFVPTFISCPFGKLLLNYEKMEITTAYAQLERNCLGEFIGAFNWLVLSIGYLR